METVNISELRANLLTYLQKAREGREITVTSHGHALATIVPPVEKSKQARAKLKQLRKTAVVHDVIGPTGNRWGALS